MELSKLRQMSSVLVTAYKNPDLDGYASAYGYAEFLSRNGVKAVAAITGNPDQETQHLLKKHKIEALPSAKKHIEHAESVILVDASDTLGIDENIKPSKVVEIIDHRAVNDIEQFKKAYVQIETIGATSTMVAEKFIETNTTMSENATILLYGGIISNTHNLKNKLTSNRDKRTAAWLTTKYQFTPDHIEKMFKAKSNHKDKTIYEILESNLAIFKFRRTQIGIVQIELIDADKFIMKNVDDIVKALRRLQKKYELDHIFSKAIDVNTARSIFIAEDLDTQKILVKNFQIEFEDNTAHSHHIITRKEIAPVLKNYFEGKEFDLAQIRPKDFNHFVRHHDDEDDIHEPVPAEMM